MKPKHGEFDLLNQRFATTIQKSGKIKGGQVLLATIPLPKNILSQLEDWKLQFQYNLVQESNQSEIFWTPTSLLHIELVSFGEVDPSTQIPLRELMRDVAFQNKPFELTAGKCVSVQKYRNQNILRLEFAPCQNYQNFRSNLEGKINDIFGTHFGKHATQSPFVTLGEVSLESQHHKTQSKLIQNSEEAFSEFQFPVTVFELLRTQPIFHNAAFETVESFFLGQKSSKSGSGFSKDLI